MLCHTLRLTAGPLSSGRGLPEFSVPITSESADCACAGSPLTTGKQGKQGRCRQVAQCHAESPVDRHRESAV